MKKYCFGVDVGGTTVKIGLFTTDGTVVDKWEIRTRKEENGSYILSDVALSLKNKLTEKNISLDDIEGIGIGVPGPVTEEGMVVACVNLGWNQVNAAEEMKKLIAVSNIKVNNDANVAALGEMWKGGGMGFQNMIMVTLGTGVGGGVIYNEQIISGSSGAAGEIGHITVEFDEPDACGCGKHGCLEQYASATGIVKMAKCLLSDSHAETTLHKYANLTAKDIFDEAKAGDTVALELVEKLGRYLGLVLSHLGAAIDPQAFVMGGGVSRAGNILTNVVEKYYNLYSMKPLQGKIFKLAELGNDAGIYGSARMVLNK